MSEDTAPLEGMGKATEPKISQLPPPLATWKQNANAFIYRVSVGGCLADFFKSGFISVLLRKIKSLLYKKKKKRI